MTADSESPGISALHLLTEKSTIEILRELDDRRLRPSELEQQLPSVPHSALMRRLAELALTGAVRHERIVAVPPRAYYSLARRGEALLQIFEASARWMRARSLVASRDDPDTLALRLLADEHTRTIMLELSDGPLRPIDLHRRLVSLSHSAIRRRLRSLVLDGILARSEGNGCRVRYILTDDARRLEFIALLAANWERQLADTNA